MNGKDKTCADCPLQPNRYVGSEGKLDAPICIIGEAPGKEEERTGRPFVGGAGTVLDMLLESVDIPRSDCYITNVVKCKPPGNKLDTPIGKAALARCKKKFYDEMVRVRSIVKVPTGNIPLHAMGVKHRIGRARGAVIVNGFGKIIPTWHPAYIMRQWQEFITGTMDWRKVKRHSLTGAFLPPQERFILSPTAGIVEKLAIELLDASQRRQVTVGIDIETYKVSNHLKTPIKLFGIATSQTEAMVVPFITQSGNYYWKSREEELRVTRSIGSILENPRITKVLHNALFDLKVLMNHGFAVVGPIFDTMIGHSLLYFPAKHSLEYLVSIYADYEPWKLEAGTTDAEYRTYNARDCCVLLLVLDTIKQDIRDNGLAYLAPKLMENILPTVRMMLNGIHVDTGQKEEVTSRIGKELVELTAELKRLSDVTALNPNSHPQLRHILFDKMKLRSDVKTPKGAKKTDEDVLKRLSLRYPDNEFVSTMMTYRKVEKLRSTYSNPPIGEDGRVHSTFKMSTVVTGRYSSSGPCLQNLPVGKKDGRTYIRAMYTAEVGHGIVTADISQAELMAYATISGDEVWLTAFRNGEDIHAINGKALTGTYEEKYRTFYKNFIFGFIYGSEGQEIERVAPKELIEKISVRQMIQSLGTTHPWLFAYRAAVAESIQRQHKIVNPFGRIRWYPKKHTKKDIREATNFPITSTVADIMHIKMAKIDTELDTERDKIILQGHDSLYVEAPTGRMDNVARIMKDIMEETTYAPNGMQFTFKADIKTGNSLSDDALEKWNGTAQNYPS